MSVSLTFAEFKQLLLELQSKQDFDSMVQVTQQALELNGRSVSLHYFYGFALLQVGELQKARVTLEQAIALSHEKNMPIDEELNFAYQTVLIKIEGKAQDETLIEKQAQLHPYNPGKIIVYGLSTIRKSGM